MAGEQLDSPGRAIVADDDEFFRLAIANVLRDRNGFSDVRVTGSMNEAIDQLGCGADFAVGLFDLNMKGMDNWGDLATIRATFPEMRLVVVSGSRSSDDIINALRAGVHGFINKGEGITALSLAIAAVRKGQTYVPPFLPEAACARKPASARPEAPVEDVKPPTCFANTAQETPSDAAKGHQVLHMTPRQREIIGLLVAGYSNKGMARALELSESTIKFHMSAILRTFGVSNRVEAATHAMRLMSQTNLV